MFNANGSSHFYEVRITTVVDHPEKRDPNVYKPVRAGHVIHMVYQFETLRGALGLRADVLEGGWDFSSEFARDVVVVQRRLNRTGWLTSRNTRKPVRRERVAGQTRAREVEPEAQAA